MSNVTTFIFIIFLEFHFISSQLWHLTTVFTIFLTKEINFINPNLKSMGFIVVYLLV